MEAASLYRGQRIMGYRESMGGDNHLRVPVVVANGTRVFLDEPE
jgi:hypothetical protein